MDLDNPVFPNVVDFLSPILENQPTGADLRDDASASAVYHALRSARTTARNNERTALSNGETAYITPSDWSDILHLAPQVLREQSKDLETAAWLIEALTRTDGFRGLAEGFNLAAQLIETFGDALHPQPDEEGKSTQLAALIGLNGLGSEGALIAPIKSIALTESLSPGPFCTWQCQQAFEVERIKDPAKREARTQRGFITRDLISQAVADSSPAFLSAVHASIDDAINAYRRYQQVIDAYCHDDPQPTARIMETLQTCMQTLTHIAGDEVLAPAAADTAPSAANTDDDDAMAQRERPAEASQGLRDRQSALASLRDVAAFFRRTEPHSPVSYAIEQAVDWAQLSLPELIEALIPDEGARKKYQVLAGIRATKKQ